MDIRKRDKKALFFIYQKLNEIIFKKVVITIDSKQAQEILQNSYKGIKKLKKYMASNFKM